MAKGNVTGLVEKSSNEVPVIFSGSSSSDHLNNYRRGDVSLSFLFSPFLR